MFARTKRLTLRPGWAEDAPALARAIAHKDVVTRISRAPWPYGEDDAREFLGNFDSLGGCVFLILVHDRGAGAPPRLIGCVGLHAEAQDRYELGYWLTPDAWGRGYATEAARAVLAAGRWSLGVRRIEAGHYIDNPASGRVLRKLGFSPTGEISPLLCRATGEVRPSRRYRLHLGEAAADIAFAAKCDKEPAL